MDSVIHTAGGAVLDELREGLRLEIRRFLVEEQC